MGWKPISQKKHHTKRESDKHPASMMRTLEDGIFVKMKPSDKEVITVVPEFEK